MCINPQKQPLHLVNAIFSSPSFVRRLLFIIARYTLFIRNITYSAIKQGLYLF
ncbi:hypothetical protein HMPREF9144_2705 [Prevotella pallens ATCC 700821]|uniref:Uncharacterized protein n=1 Tax=Prevotella pallens ATCC 700821 TaxID=997353 RepID=F9DM13_9BACT|nr:hypothetical protein HMPREF9144_2705 [Prevotella pallens ATCC 700821]